MCGVNFLLHHPRISSVNSAFHTSAVAGTGLWWGNGKRVTEKKKGEISEPASGWGGRICQEHATPLDDPDAHAGRLPGDLLVWNPPCLGSLSLHSRLSPELFVLCPGPLPHCPCQSRPSCSLQSLWWLRLAVLLPCRGSPHPFCRDAKGYHARAILWAPRAPVLLMHRV